MCLELRDLVGHVVCKVLQVLQVCQVIAKFHYTDPTRTKSVHVVGYELNSTTQTRHGPTGPALTRTDFFAAKLRWVRVGSGRVRVVEFSYKRATAPVQHGLKGPRAFRGRVDAPVA